MVANSSTVPSGVLPMVICWKATIHNRNTHMSHIHTHESHTRKHIHESHTSSVVYWQGSHTRRLVLRTQRVLIIYKSYTSLIQVLYKSYTDTTYKQCCLLAGFSHSEAGASDAESVDYIQVLYKSYTSLIQTHTRKHRTQVLYKSYTDTHSQAPNTRKYRHTHAHQTHANTDTHEEVWHVSTHVRFFSGVCCFVRQIARGSIPSGSLRGTLGFSAGYLGVLCGDEYHSLRGSIPFSLGFSAQSPQTAPASFASLFASLASKKGARGRAYCPPLPPLHQKGCTR